MLVLLPPSETKREGGVGSFDASQLHAASVLDVARGQVQAALEALCAIDADEDVAARTLKLGVKNRSDLERNRVLGTSGVMPAIDRYTGVLYDALDAVTLGEHARDWAGSHVRVQSALFGQVRALDEIPAYRLSASTRLPALGAPLKRVWSAAHEPITQAGFTLDLRSKDYAALAPLPRGSGYSLQVMQRSVDGQMRALNHFNKAAKGDLVRRLAESGRAVSTVEELIDWASAEGLEITISAGELMLVTGLGAPALA